MSEEEVLAELNRDLAALVEIFPNIQPEVFREILSTLSGTRRLQIATKSLLKDQDAHVKGRWRVPGKSTGPAKDGADKSIPKQDIFRSKGYKKAVRALFCQEFKGLSRSSIDAVLAEKNFCYSLARPTLQEIAARSWRYSITSVFWRWRKPAGGVLDDHPMLLWDKISGQGATARPSLKETGNVALDRELHRSVLAPLLEKSKAAQAAIDWELALCVNEMEAESAGAIYECECCFSDTTFEQMSTCTTGGHIVCFRCLRNAINEALFGQGWGRNIDHDRGQIKCMAPTSGESCHGCIPQAIAKRAASQEKGGQGIWDKLEARLASEALQKAQVPLVHCPFCSYAEVDELYLPPSSIQYRLKTSQPLTTLFILALTLVCIPLLALYALLCQTLPSFNLPTFTSLRTTSLHNLTRRKHLSPRFQCRSPTCSTSSCLLCHKPWHDPHACHESATLSLRTTIEAARTSALKRTCPRCGLGFVKDSGCNKMTCVCGYVMCYVCRQGLGKERGYEHFCQHFRPAGGPCGQCERCDLYRGEDEEGAVKRAGVVAEKEWREREGMVGVEGIGGLEKRVDGWWEGEWTLQRVVDWWVEGLVSC